MPDRQENLQSGSAAIRTKQLRRCGLLRALLVVLPLLLGVVPAQADTPSGAIPSNYMGLTINDSGVAAPSVSYGLLRFWDTGNNQWPYINTADGVYKFNVNGTGLDNWLQNLKSASVDNAFYTLNRTPNWALAAKYKTGGSSSTAAQQCNYYGVGGNTTTYGAQGQCYPPGDLNDDGTGTNQHWIDWVTNIATHVKNLDHNTYATIKYWEIWNEVERSDTIAHDADNPSYRGTYAQLLRMTEDARCIITGNGVIHNNGYNTNGTQKAPSQCNLKAIDSTALIVMPSGHPESSGEYAVAQNFLYCNSSTNTICSNSANGSTGNEGAAAIDIANFHVKPANISNDVAGTSDMEASFQTLYGNIQKVVTAGNGSAANLPLWNGEAGYDAESKGWGALINVDLRESFVARFFLMNWSLGIQSVSWYNWDGADQLNDKGSLPGMAYQQLYNWLGLGDNPPDVSMTSSCTNGTGSAKTQWTCGFTGTGTNSTYQAEAIWDTAYSCNSAKSSGGCVTPNNVTVNSKWKNYVDLTGTVTPITKDKNGNWSVPVSIKPILLQN